MTGEQKTLPETRAKLKAVLYGVLALGMPISIVVYVFFRHSLYRLGPAHLELHLARYWLSYSMLLFLVSFVLFLVDAFRSPRVPAAKRKLWVALLIFGGFNVMPFYWWWYVRPSQPGRERRPGSTPPGPPVQ